MSASLQGRHWRNLVLLAGSFIVSFLLAEGSVRLFMTVRNVGPTFSQYDSKFGKRLKPNFHCTRITPEFTMEFSTNDEGFRGPKLNPLSRRPILFLGDSFTAGYGVNDGEEYPDRIRVALQQRYGTDKIPVVNAAVGNIGNGYWLKFLRDEGKRLHPQFVILQLSLNDFDDNANDGLFTLDASGGLLELSPPGKSLMRSANEFIDLIPGLSYSHFVALIRQWLAEDAGRNDVPHVDDSTASRQNTLKERLTYLILRKTIELCLTAEWPVAALLVDIQGERRTELETLFESYGIPTIAVPLKQHRPDLYYRIDGHWNAAGHQFVAQLVLESFPENLRLD